MRPLKTKGIVAMWLVFAIPLGVFSADIAPYKPRSKANVSKEISQDSENLRGIVVKFHEHTGVRLNKGNLESPKHHPKKASVSKTKLNKEINNLEKELKKYGATIKRRFRQPEEELDALKAKATAKRKKETANLNLYYTVELSSNNQGAKELLEFLNSLESVEISYFDIQVPPPAASDTPDFSGQQNYFGSASNELGIDAARAYAGSLGDNVAIADIEWSVRTTHEDFPAFLTVQGNNPSNTNFAEHGTAVAGVVVGINDGFGTDGIVPNAGYGFFSQLPNSVAQAILDATSWLKGLPTAQKVILMETQAAGISTDGNPCNTNPMPQTCFVPSEWNSAVYDAIEAAVYAEGITVIEAAGNGSNNLDDPIYNNVFDPDFQHSGAIIIGGGQSGSLQPNGTSNTGSRVDVHAWGANVTTTGYGNLFTGPGNPLGGGDNCNPCVGDVNRYYTSSFSGTSSASALSAGTSGAILSMAAAANISVLPQQLSRLLRYTGTPQTSGGNIGPRIFVSSAMDAMYQIRPVLDWQIPQEYAISANDYLTLNDRVKCWEGSVNSSNWCTTRSGSANLGVDAESGKVIATDVWLRDRSQVHGDVYADNLTVQNNVVIDGNTFNSSSAGEDIPITTYAHQFTGSGQEWIENGEGVLLWPDTYGDYNVRGGAVLAFTSGTYYFNRLEFESNSQVQFFANGGPIRIYVRDHFNFRGTINNLSTAPAEDILLGYVGTNGFWIDHEWTGTVVAPNATVILGQSSNGRVFEGMFVANAVSVHQNTKVVFNPFDFDL